MQVIYFAMNRLRYWIMLWIGNRGAAPINVDSLHDCVSVVCGKNRICMHITCKELQNYIIDAETHKFKCTWLLIYFLWNINIVILVTDKIA